MVLRTYGILDSDGTTPRAVLQGNAVAGADIVPATQLVAGDGTIVEPASAGGQALLQAAIGAQADPAWSGSGGGSVLTVLKALWQRLGGVGLASGSAVIGRVGLQVAGADVSTANGAPVIEANWQPKGVRQGMLSSAVSLAILSGAALPLGARMVWVQPEDGDIRMRDDGSDPTTSTGLLIRRDVMFPYVGSLAAVRLVAVSAATRVNLAFYG